MSSAARLQAMLKAMGATALVLLLVLLFVHDSGTLSQARAISQRLDSVDHERLEALVAEKATQVLQPLAVLVDGRRGQLIEDLKALSDQGALRAWAGALKASKARQAAAPKPQAALDAAAANPGGWTSLLLLDPTGKVVAQWPQPAVGQASELGADLSKEALVKALAQPGQAPGLPQHGYRRVAPAKPEPKPEPKADPKAKALVKPAVAAPTPKATAHLEAACGIEGPDGSIASVLLARLDVRPALLGDGDPDLDALLRSAPGAAAFLVRGNGEEVWHSSKEPLTENLASISPEYKQLLAGVLKDPVGRRSVASYDGQPGVLVWQRVGSAPEGSLPEDVLSLALFMPEKAFAISAGALMEAPRPWFKRPLVLLLALLLLALPLAYGWAQAPKALEPFRATAIQARKVEEFSPVPELSLAEEPDADAQAINRAFSVLAKRAQQGEERVHELDAALRRVEEQAGRDATASAHELSGLREKVGGADAARLAAEAKFESAQKARQEAEAQLANLRSALETATRNTELKAAENRNLSAQVQDLMRAMEEQRKVAEKAQESLARKDSEVVRLAAVNTLSSELKATLSVIKNYINTMLGSQGAISDAQQEFLGVVINKSARLERLIGDLVELSELGSGVKPLRLESVSPSALVQEALVNARPQAEAKKINLELAEGGNLSPVAVDREKMGAVLRSLLSQAVKVTSRNEKIGLLLSERESTVELRVTDPGMSLPPDRSAKVFNQFHGVDSQAGPEFIGTGLRFPILKSVVEAHGGKIWIESQVGRGKTFVVAMPKAGAALGSLPAPVTVALPTAAKPVPMPVGPTASKPPVPIPVLPALPALGPPPMVAAPVVSKPVLPASLPPLGPPPAIAVEKPVTASGPVIHKPAPLDENLNSPWKRKDSKPDDLLEETMDLPTPVAGPKEIPSLPPLAPPASAPLPTLPTLASLPAKPVLKTDAKPNEDEKADFDKVFGAIPEQAEEKAVGALPKVELKTNAKPDDRDLAQFASVFGGVAPKAAPPGMGAPPPPAAPAPANPADFDALFGSPAPSAATTPPPLSAPKTAPPGLGVPPPPSPTDFDAIFGAAPVAPPPALKTPPPGLGTPPAPAPSAAKPALPPGMADLDAIFGAPTAPQVAMPPPVAPDPASPGLNTMDDLNRMLGN